MAFETGTLSGIADFWSKFNTFVTANGWTQDQLDTVNRRYAFHKNSLYLSSRGASDTFSAVSLHQALGYTGGNMPGKHPNDSGQGYNATTSQTRANLITERYIDFVGTGPYPTYWFFENDASPAYVHGVIEVSVGRFAHFGIGELVKFGTWTGGEYCYGHHINGSSMQLQPDSCIGLDGLASSTAGTDEDRVPTLHCEGLPSQPGTGKWGVVWARDTSLGVDDAGVAREYIQGGFRAGPIASDFGFFAGSIVNGLIPMYPIALWHVTGDIAVGSGALGRYIGYQADVRGINIRNFTPGQEIPYGGDTWIVFPSSIRDTAAITGSSGYQGIAYKKVTA